MSDCFFCICVENKDYELENEYAFARFDDFPVSDGHMIIVSKRHIKDWWDATAEEKIAISNLINQSKEIIEKKYKPDAYNIGMNLGEAAGQTVMHLHVHIIPRYKGDVLDPRGGVRGVIPEKSNYV